MARIPMVTRTILTTKATVFCVNTEDRTTFEQSITLPRTYKDDDKLMKAITKLLENEPVKAVAIVSTEVIETLYGMTESDFIRYATVLPPRTNTQVSNNTDDLKSEK